MVVDQEIQAMSYPTLMGWVSTRVYTRLQAWALKRAEYTVRFTELACAALVERYGDSIRTRFIVNRMGIELPEAPHREQISDPVRLLWVGQLIPRKRIDVAIEALSNLQQFRWQFDIVGDGPERPHLEGLVAAHGLCDRVHFHGFRSDPRSWYRQADLLLFPSWSENCPVTMLEAMSFAVPCLAMRADGIRYHNANEELIEDQVDGFLAESDDDFRFQLERLLAQAHLLVQAGCAARHRMAEKHSWDKHIDCYENIFNTLVSQRSVGSVVSLHP
jgi:glycosyltransferase involved in cell wall biosynthesis